MKELFNLTQENYINGQIFFSWQKGINSKYLAVTENSKIINILDKYGNKIYSFNLNGSCIGLSWNNSGFVLALITNQSPAIKLWEIDQNKIISIDTGIQESFNLILWAIKSQNLLAVTTSKGNLLIYDHDSTRKIPILGKHSKKIVSGVWTKENLLALICEDQMLSISDETGDTLYTISLKGKSSLLKTSLNTLDFLNSENSKKNILNIGLSFIFNQKQIHIINLNNFEQTLKLTFQENYGNIKNYFWLSNSNMIVVFERGHVINVNTSSNQFGQEIVYVHLFTDKIDGTNYCETNNNLLVFKNNIIKIVDINSLDQIDKVFTLEEETSLSFFEWSPNGKMLACCSNLGNLRVFLTKIPKLGCAYLTKIAYLTSLLELTYFDIENQKNLNQKPNIHLDIEPTVLSIGLNHLVACINNKAFFYLLKNSESTSWQDSVKEVEYSNIIKCIILNELFAALLFNDHKICLHYIPEFNYNEVNQTDVSIKENKKKDFFQGNLKDEVCDIALSENFFIWCTRSGIIEFFSTEEWSTVAIYRHIEPIEKIFSDNTGLRILIVDIQNTAYIYNVVKEQMIPLEYDLSKNEHNLNEEIFEYSSSILNIPEDSGLVVAERVCLRTFPLSASQILWDTSDNTCFIVVNDKQILVYFYVAKSISGSFVQLVDIFNLNYYFKPLLFRSGILYFQTENALIKSLLLDTFNYQKEFKDQYHLNEVKDKIFSKLLKLRKYQDCWNVCLQINNLDYWKQFINCCLHDLNLNAALKIARYIGDAGLVWSLESIMNTEEKNLLSAHVAMFLKWFDLSEQLYLKSSNPLFALRLRLDLMQWEASLILAKRLCPEQLPYINKQHANELEFNGNYLAALNHYEDALHKNKSNKTIPDAQHNLECKAGISRCLIRSGNQKKGLELAFELDSNNFDLIKSCAQVCEESSMFHEGAVLYEKANDLENASLLYLRIRNLNKVKQLLNKTKQKPNTNMLKIYAKMQEQDGKYEDALTAYQQANLHLECVRILLDKLNRPQQAIQLVENKKLNDAYFLIAHYFQKINDYKSAIEFLVYSKKYEEAFELAMQNLQMQLYSSTLINFLVSQNQQSNKLNIDIVDFTDNLDEKIIKQFQQIALFYEEEKNFFSSGKFYCLSGQIQKGVKFLLQAYSSKIKNLNQEECEDALKLAIEFVCKSNDQDLIRNVIETFVKNLTQNQNHFKYLFKLYMCSGQYKEANKTTIFLAREHQNKGNYDLAYDLVVQMAKILIEKKIKPSFELMNILHLLHCYFLAKLYFNLKQNEQSCELFCKISNNINKFPMHAGQILTSTIIQCLKVGLKSKAIKLSILLMQNESYFKQIDLKYKKKINALIRKSAIKENNVENENMFNEEKNCPFCDQMVPNLQLTCNSCRNIIPFSIITGYHLTKENIFICNHCKFPFNLDEFKTFKNFKQDNCPMCKNILNYETISKLESLN